VTGFEVWREYDDQNRLISYTSSKKSWKRWTYDDNNYSERYEDSSGVVYVTEYNTAWDVTYHKEVLPPGISYESWYEYDDSGRMIRFRTNMGDSWVRRYENGEIRYVSGKDKYNGYDVIDGVLQIPMADLVKLLDLPAFFNEKVAIV